MTPEACARFFPEFPGFPCHRLILCFATGFLPGLTKITHSVSLYWDLTLVTQNRKSENFAESKFDEGDPDVRYEKKRRKNRKNWRKSSESERQKNSALGIFFFCFGGISEDMMEIVY